MASFVLDTLSTTSQNLSGTEFGILTPNASLITSGTAITLTPGAGFTLTQISVGGTITSHTSGARAIQGSGSGIVIDIGPQGSITSLRDEALFLTVTDNFLYITNYGVVKGFSDGLQTNVSGGVGRDTIINHGVFSGTTGPALDIIFSNGRFSITNTGTITSGESAAIRTSDSSGGTATALVKNSGEIIGGGGSGSVVVSYDGSTGEDIILNSGTMIGDVLLEGNADRYDGNGGVVNGVIVGAAGNDTLLGGSQSDHMLGGTEDDLIVGRDGDDSLFGEAGGDRIIGGGGNDVIDGAADSDTLSGNSGDDTMTGGTGDDLLVGQEGADQLDGGDDNDTLDGGAGDDILEGGNGNDILRGRSGEDELAGGLGRDFLTGGQGADSFVFRSISEAGLGAARDQILDFQPGVDLIVVAGLSPGVFEFRGTNSFAPSGNPELRLFETPTGSTIVQIDADGNGSIDAEIRVAGVTGLTAEDFVL
jgi:Ca2+-binding RTX toxin-like protein